MKTQQFLIPMVALVIFSIVTLAVAQIVGDPGSPLDPEQMFSLDSGIRVEQELIFSELFGENVLIGNVYDHCLLDVVIDEQIGFGTAWGAAVTDDGRWYTIEVPVAVESPITLENGYEETWIELAEVHDMRCIAVWAMLRSLQNPLGVPATCPWAIPTAVGIGMGILTDGADLWSDAAGFGDSLMNAYGDCCQDLKLR